MLNYKTDRAMLEREGSINECVHVSSSSFDLSLISRQSKSYLLDNVCEATVGASLCMARRCAVHGERPIPRPLKSSSTPVHLRCENCAMNCGCNAERYPSNNAIQVVSKDLRVSGFFVETLYHMLHRPHPPFRAPIYPTPAHHSNLARYPPAPIGLLIVLRGIPQILLSGACPSTPEVRGSHARARRRRRGDRAGGNSLGGEGYHFCGEMIPDTLRCVIESRLVVRCGVLDYAESDRTRFAI